MAVVLVYSYTGNLTSQLTTPKLKPIPNSFEELAASSDYKLAVGADTVLSEEILVILFYLITLYKFPLFKLKNMTTAGQSLFNT